MSDRTINFGESETEATYQIQDTDSTGGGNFVVAKDTNANTVLLQYDPDTDTWEYAGDVDMNGGNVSGVGTLTAESVNTEELTTENSSTVAFMSQRQTISDLDTTQVEFDATTVNQIGFDTSNNKFVASAPGTFSVSVTVSVLDGPDTEFRLNLEKNGDTVERQEIFRDIGDRELITIPTREVELDAGDELVVSVRLLGSSSNYDLFENDKRTRMRIRRV